MAAGTQLLGELLVGMGLDGERLCYREDLEEEGELVAVVGGDGLGEKRLVVLTEF